MLAIRFLVLPARLVLGGGFASLHGMVWATYVWGMGVMDLLVCLLSHSL